MNTLLIKNGRVIDPLQQLDQICDIYIENSIIKSIGKLEKTADTVIDATGLVVSPGLIDMHVHLRDPGFTHKEDIVTGCEAAAAGGVTSVVAMPNTNPVTDSEETIKYILDKSKYANAHVYPVASITKGLLGEAINDFKALKSAGAVAVSDDGRPVENAYKMQLALERAYDAQIPVISHCEDMDIIRGGIINEGVVSKELSVPGMHRSSEDSITAREIALAAATDTRIHIAHVSTKGSVNIIRSAKQNGVKVTCETCPHYFSLTEKELLKKDADYRMNPPLREQRDVDAIIEAIIDGTIDCIVTDHAPHTSEEKADFLKAPNGVVGLETSLAATLTKLYHEIKLPLSKIISLMSTNPARLLNISGGNLKIGSTADITVFNPDEEWYVEPEKLHSKSKNSVFKGKTLKGKVKYTVLNGNIVYKNI